jgi:hypothetical protein
MPHRNTARRLRSIFAAILVVGALPVYAQSVFSAKSLMELDEADAGLFVLGWLAGFDSANLISTYSPDAEATKLRVCVPPNTNGKIAYAVIQAHYNKLKDPQSGPGAPAWNQVSWLPAGMFVHSALAKYWPCNPK